jgi:pyridoxine kinase
MTLAAKITKTPLTILAISSQVVRGSVGLSVIVPALQSLGHRVWPMPTIVLSNHPGHTQTAAVQTPPERMRAMFDALVANGWLGEIDAVLSGYLPTPAHVELTAEIVKSIQAIDRTKVRHNRPRVHYLCDPVLGDDPKGLYIDPAAAAAIRDHLLPLADTITPNRFELSWLSGRAVGSTAETVTAARQLAVPNVVATSIPSHAGRLANVAVGPHTIDVAEVNKLSGVPHGTGDLFGALYLSGAVLSSVGQRTLDAASAGVASVIEASHGQTELTLLATKA